MRKFVAAALCLIMLMSLFSCDIENSNDNKDNDITSNTDSNTSQEETDATPIQKTQSEIAMKMYEQAIKGEICIIDEHLGEIKLKDCQFPSDGLRLDDCDILYKAILDMDGDGINEYVIKSETKEHIVLHYYDGKVYS